MSTQKSEAYPPVRRVTRKDRVKLSELIKLFAERSGNANIVGMIPGQKSDDKSKKPESESAQTYALIKSVLKNLLEWTEKELSDFFMDLIGVTDRAEYDKMPFDIEMYIIDELIGQKGFNGFFTRASALYKKIRG